MQVTKGTWRMREQCVPGSLSSSPAREPGNEAISLYNLTHTTLVFPAAWQRVNIGGRGESFDSSRHERCAVFSHVK